MDGEVKHYHLRYDPADEHHLHHTFFQYEPLHIIEAARLYNSYVTNSRHKISQVPLPMD
jgi:hypothetical protein